MPAGIGRNPDVPQDFFRAKIGKWPQLIPRPLEKLKEVLKI